MNKTHDSDELSVATTNTVDSISAIEMQKLSKEQEVEGLVTGDSVKVDSHGLVPGTASNTQVAFNIIISFVGAGMLGMPYAFRQSGWALGCIALGAVSFFNVYCMLLLTKIRKKLVDDGHENLHGYGDVGRVIMGEAGETAVNICLVVSQVGFATAYIIFIAANLYSIAEVPAMYTCFACVPILSLLCQAMEMKTLSPFSLIADLANLAGLSAVLLQDYEDYEPHDDPIKLFDFSNLLYVTAISLYSLEGVGLILSLESSCKNPEKFPTLLKSVILGITVLMCIFGTAGYIAFGDKTQAPITLNLVGKGWAMFVKAALCLALYLTYPIMMFPVHGVVENLISTLRKTCPRITYRILLVVLTAVVAFTIPDFGKFLSLVGSSICVILGFIFPCYFHLKVFGKTLPLWQICLDSTLMVGGTIFGMMGTYDSFCNLIWGKESAMGEG